MNEELRGRNNTKVQAFLAELQISQQVFIQSNCYLIKTIFGDGFCHFQFMLK